MRQPEFRPRLIHTKRGAVIILCVTAYLAALSVRDVLWLPQRQHHWLLDLDQLVFDLHRLGYWHISLPAWVVAEVNLGFYAALLWGGAMFYRIAQGKERLLVAGWGALIFLNLIQVLISASVANAINPVRAIMAGAAFLAAVDIFLKMPAGGYPRVDNQTSRNT
ncbi:MAG: hypothetical protein WA639_03405 [Candidatus Acidiferrum sp.]